MFNVNGNDVFLIATVMVFVVYLVEKIKPSPHDIELNETVMNLRKKVYEYSSESAEYKGKYWEIKRMYDELKKETK